LVNEAISCAVALDYLLLAVKGLKVRLMLCFLYLRFFLN